jgi:N-acetylglucosamine malate deacetylase 1
MAGAPHYPARIYHYFAVHLRLVAKPAFVVDVTQDLPVKLAALACYRSQFADNERNATVLPWVEQQAAVWGSLIGTAAGEPFFSAEEIGVSSVRDLV